MSNMYLSYFVLSTVVLILLLFLYIYCMGTKHEPFNDSAFKEMLQPYFSGHIFIQGTSVKLVSKDNIPVGACTYQSIEIHKPNNNSDRALFTFIATDATRSNYKIYVSNVFKKNEKINGYMSLARCPNAWKMTLVSGEQEAQQFTTPTSFENPLFKFANGPNMILDFRFGNQLEAVEANIANPITMRIKDHPESVKAFMKTFHPTGNGLILIGNQTEFKADMTEVEMETVYKTMVKFAADIGSIHNPSVKYLQGFYGLNKDKDPRKHFLLNVLPVHTDFVYFVRTKYANDNNVIANTFKSKEYDDKMRKYAGLEDVVEGACGTKGGMAISNNTINNRDIADCLTLCKINNITKTSQDTCRAVAFENNDCIGYRNKFTPTNNQRKFSIDSSCVSANMADQAEENASFDSKAAVELFTKDRNSWVFNNNGASISVVSNIQMMPDMTVLEMDTLINKIKELGDLKDNETNQDKIDAIKDINLKHGTAKVSLAFNIFFRDVFPFNQIFMERLNASLEKYKKLNSGAAHPIHKSVKEAIIEHLENKHGTNMRRKAKAIVEACGIYNGNAGSQIKHNYNYIDDAENASACVQFCRKNGNCKAFTYNKKLKQCEFYKDTFNASRDARIFLNAREGCLSGNMVTQS